ncbi:MAG: hypothetical protein GKC53_03335 [Neisseriaceae bacterium]|nr:MAG: hypothetical protein GKC53_03335 [Neisseriaceae bacterium]
MSGSSGLIILILFVFLLVLIVLRRSDQKKIQKNNIFRQESLFRGNKSTNHELSQNTTQSENFTGRDDVIDIQAQGESGRVLTIKNKGVVSSEAIDKLQEYRLFKELGYYRQAAEILSELINSNKRYREVEYIVDLADLYIQTEEINKLDELLEDYALLLDTDQLQGIFVRGFYVDPTNYRLQLICSKALKQDPTQLGAVIEKK